MSMCAYDTSRNRVLVSGFERVVFLLSIGCVNFIDNVLASHSCHGPLLFVPFPCISLYYFSVVGFLFFLVFFSFFLLQLFCPSPVFPFSLLFHFCFSFFFSFLGSVSSLPFIPSFCSFIHFLPPLFSLLSHPDTASTSLLSLPYILFFPTLPSSFSYLPPFSTLAVTSSF